MTTTYRFDDFTLDRPGHRLLRENLEVELPPKAFELLVFLLERPGVVVTKQQLLDELWPGITVTENTLAQRIREIRVALSDDAGEPRFLRTIARVGYKFVAPVDAGTGAPDVAVEAVAAPTGTADPAVLEAATVQPAEAPAAPAGRRWLIGLPVAGVAVLVVWAVAARPEDTAAVPAATQQLISTLPGSQRHATFSPDGRLVAFTSDVDGVPQVWVKPLPEGDPIQITFGDRPARRPRWSPTNDQIVFEREEEGIWGVPPLGGTPHQILDAGRNASFSPDGAHLVFERARQLWMCRSDGSDAQRLEAAPDWTFGVDASPAWSPDGRWIALFVQESGPHGDFWKVPVDGTEAVRLTYDVAEGGTPVWTPDGTEIVFSSNRSGARALWRVSEDGGEPRPLTAGAGEDMEPAITADGRRIVYTTVRHRWTIDALDLTTGDRRALLERRTPLWLPRFSPAGDRITFFQSLGPSVHLFTMNADGSNLAQVTRGDGERMIHPGFSPDGAWLYFYQDHPAPSFRRMPVEGGESVEVAPDWRWTSHINGQVSPDGTLVIVTRQTAQEGTTVLRDLASGRETDLPWTHLHGMRWSPDGTRILGWRHDGLMAICPLEGRECRTAGSGTRPVWSADGGTIYFHRPTARPDMFELWAVDAAGGHERKLGEMGPMHPMALPFDVSPQGLAISSGFVEGRYELWVMDLPR